MKNKILLISAVLLFITSSPPARENLRENAVVKAVERSSPAVVNISTEEVIRERVNPFYLDDPFFRRFFDNFFEPRMDRRYTLTSLGSGTIIDRGGYILTNEHVVLRASGIKVIMSDEREFMAEVVGSDSDLDLAVLKVESDKPLPVIPMGTSSDLMIGEDVICIGNPFGLSHTVTRGIISALDRSIKTKRRVYTNFIQTDASINPGNSGGPLLNIEGNMIGVNTAIYGDAEGIGFAIPVDRAMRAAEDLMVFGEVRTGWLGMKVQALTADLASWLGLDYRKGVLISDVMEGSPAERAGLRKTDVILKINGGSLSSRDELAEELAGYGAGSEIKLSIYRDGEVISRAAVLDEFTNEVAYKVAWDRLGMRVMENNSQIARRYGLRDDKGVVIKELRRSGPATARGLKPGDIILRINGSAIEDMSSFRDAVQDSFWLDNVIMNIRRGPYLYRVPLDLA